MQRAVRLPLELTEVPLEELERLGAQDFWHDHKLGRERDHKPDRTTSWRVARESREIPDISAYPKIVAIADLVPAPRHQIWVSVLAAGGVIRTHSDSERAGAVRVHVPLIGKGTFEVEDKRYEMRIGEFWAVDTVGRPHGAKNDGSVARVHLLVDVLPNHWLREHVPWL